MKLYKPLHLNMLRIYRENKTFTKISDTFTKISDMFTKISDYGFMVLWFAILPYCHITIQYCVFKFPQNIGFYFVWFYGLPYSRTAIYYVRRTRCNVAANSYLCTSAVLSWLAVLHGNGGVRFMVARPLFPCPRLDPRRGCHSSEAFGRPRRFFLPSSSPRPHSHT